ncbi:MAG TPA: ATP-binding cassette domain-containing protein, partial [Ectothiorhodospiraceae bacterium]|nr:ATP-binding cassette domain-containing protein [Ectothiorhodospiraceae bacterium]
MRGIVKRFGNLTANADVNLSIKKGEIRALVGENGAGKTTLMRILFGLYQPDDGEIRIRGRVVEFHSPRDAISQGIGMVHQHFMLFDDLSVAENVVFG